MPYGIIDKTIPGIGATTLELEAERNSIIVVPTKALAEEKCNKYPFAMYVGSQTIVRRSPSKYNITGYVCSPFIKCFKKVIVVADSL